MTNFEHGQGDEHLASPLVETVEYPRLEMDRDRYAAMMQSENPEEQMSDEKIDECLNILWNIAHTCADIGWGLNLAQFYVDETIRICEDSLQDSVKLLEQKDNMPLLIEGNQSANQKEE